MCLEIGQLTFVLFAFLFTNMNFWERALDNEISTTCISSIVDVCSSDEDLSACELLTIYKHADCTAKIPEKLVHYFS